MIYNAALVSIKKSSEYTIQYFDKEGSNAFYKKLNFIKKHIFPQYYVYEAVMRKITKINKKYKFIKGSGENRLFKFIK